MSTSVDQRGKGQNNAASNGSSKEGEYDYMQSHQAYGAAQAMNSPNAEPYASSYYMPQYMFPNMAQDGVSAGAWSNGDPMSFLGGYGQMSDQYMSGNNMYGGFDNYQFNWGFPSGDFNTWGTSQPQGARKDDVYATDPYYNVTPREISYGAMNGELETADIRSVDSGMKSMSITDKGDGRDSSVHGSSQEQNGTVAPSNNASSAPASGAPKRMTWASVASQPARPQPQIKPKSIPRAPLNPGRSNMDIGTWDGKNSSAKQGGAWSGERQMFGASRGRGGRSAPAGPYGQGSHSGANSHGPSGGGSGYPKPSNDPANPTLEKLKSANQYNPKELLINVKNARYFIIKSYSEDDIHRSIKYGIWCSTEHGNKRLDAAYHERDDKGPVYFFFSVNGSGHFCGMAQMLSSVDYSSSSSVWAQDKWRGQMEVKWIYVKDVPNSQLRHIRLENNENKPVTNSRDTQEVPPEKGKQVLKIIHHYRHTTSIFDDFSHYEKRQEDDTKPDQPRGDRRGDDRRDRRAQNN